VAESGGVSAPVVVGFGDFGDDSVDAFHDIVDVGEVSFHLAMVEDVDGPIFQDGLGKQEEGHVRTSPGTVDGEEPETGAVQVIEAAVAVGHELVGFFSGSI
jgi:hypothetical protein